MRTHAASRVATLDERQILDDPAFWRALQPLAEQQDRSVADVEHYARRCLEELAVHPQDRYLDFVARLARFMYTRSYAADLDVNTGVLEQLKERAKQHPMVFLWSHKSHLDSFVFMRALYDARFTPQPLSFAGINMNFAGFGALAKRSGAIFLRRSFKDDPIYKLVLQHYIDYLVAKRLPLSWSIEGTRSRTGMLMPPKLGLIQWVLDAYRRASCDDVLLVPVAISFDQIAEINDYVDMQRGVPKRKESLKWFIDYIAGMRTPQGRIYVRFAEPVALSDSVDISDALVRGEPEQIHAQKLAFMVCNRIERVKPITATDLVTLVLLAANGRGMDIRQIHAHMLAILELIEQRGLPTAGDLLLGELTNLEAALETLTATGLLSCFHETGTSVYVITPGRQLAAAYYRNTIVHYFLTAAVAEVAMASVAAEPYEPAFRNAVMSLRDLLKFDFFFQKKSAFTTDAIAFMDGRYPDWRQVAAECFRSKPPLFGHGILRSFIETYRILAAVLLARTGESIPPGKRDGLIRDCLGKGEEMLARRLLSTEAALSQPLIVNAIRLADYRQLLHGTIQELAAGRAQFSADVARATDAVNQLQLFYDQGWTTPRVSGRC